MKQIVFLATIFVGGFALYRFLSSQTAAGLDATETAFLIIAALVMLAYAVVLLSDYRGRWMDALRHGAIWIGLFLAFAVLYTFRNDLSTMALRVASETLPPGTIVTLEESQAAHKAVRIRRQRNGHFSAHGKVNGTGIRMLIDTGASTVVLKPADAQKAGIDLSTLRYSVPVSTANGTAYAAPVQLRSVAVGSIELENVQALVTRPGALNESLLGMSFLRRLRSYEFSGEFLTLKG